jgi:hypothetical protein
MFSRKIKMDDIMPTVPFLSTAQTEEFQHNGVLVLRDFYDLSRDIEPIQRAIYNLIGVLIAKYRLPISRPAFAPASFDFGYQELIAANRSYGAELYDAVKQIPAFVRLVAHPLHDRLFTQLRPGSMPAVAAGGYGIRIDNPSEDRFRANWHQEYPAQLRSLDGLVYWSPLAQVTNEMGPVEFCPGSQVEGALPVYTRDTTNPEKTGAYSLTLRSEAEMLRKYPHVAPLTSPGDLVVIDVLVLHASGHNRSHRSRWTMQLRYFNFLEPTGQSHGWRGSYAAGVDFRTVHPELCAD